jgi:hypothetical protein
VKPPLFLLVTPFLLYFLSPLAQTASKTVLATESCPYFDKPETGLLPKGFLEKRDTCRTDSTVVDSAGVAWFKIHCKNSSGWASARNFRFVSEIPTDFFSQEAKGDNDKKRRADIIKGHPDWPLRIKKAVRAGQVCLDMSPEQLVASWGEPQEKQKMFMLGVGDYASFVYKGTEKGSLMVSLQNNRVIGWSVEE